MRSNSSSISYISAGESAAKAATGGDPGTAGDLGVGGVRGKLLIKTVSTIPCGPGCPRREGGVDPLGHLQRLGALDQPRDEDVAVGSDSPANQRTVELVGRGDGEAIGVGPGELTLRIGGRRAVLPHLCGAGAVAELEHFSLTLERALRPVEAIELVDPSEKRSRVVGLGVGPALTRGTETAAQRLQHAVES